MHGIAEIREVVSTLRPDRVGNGILAAQDEKLMGQIGEANRRGSIARAAEPTVSVGV